MAISKEKVEEVLKLEAFDRYDYFIKRVKETEKFFVLEDENNDLEIMDLGDAEAIAVWPDQEFADIFIQGEWKDCNIKRYSLKHLKSTLLPTCKKKQWEIDVFPLIDKSGVVASYSDVEKDLQPKERVKRNPRVRNKKKRDNTKY